MEVSDTDETIEKESEEHSVDGSTAAPVEETPVMETSQEGPDKSGVAEEPDSAAEKTAEDPAGTETPEDDGTNQAVHAHMPQFSNLGTSPEGVAGSSMSRFLDVSVQVSAELGSIKMPIGEVLQLGEGSVIELNRNLAEPIDLVAQGVRIARGEVIVIDDCFAIRIKEIESNQINR